MANDGDDEHTFGFSEDDYDWNRYARVRPEYPDALWSQILAYHHTQSNGLLQTAHDVGSGFGVVAGKFLIPNFQHVYVSDPVAHNFQQAKLHLAPFGSSKLTLKQARAEDKWLLAESIDMVTAFECLHWTDSRRAIASIAHQLKPGGTVAALYYTPRPFFVNNKRADKIWQVIFDKYAARSYEPDSTTSKWLSGCFHGMDTHVELPPSLFEEGIQRIQVNTELLKNSLYNTPETPFKIGVAHVQDDARIVVGPDDICSSIIDVENYGLRVDYEWLVDFIRSLQPRMPLDRLQEELKELKAALVEEHGTTQIAWIMQLLFATKWKTRPTT